MAEPIRWGILGAARFARQQMAPAIHAARGARLAALATSSPEKAAPFEAFAPGLEVHDSYEALLADPEIDAVYIPLPNTLHVEWTLKAVAAGKHVLCEKPVAMAASDIDRLIAARDASGLLVAEAFMIVHHPQWQRTRTLLRDGAIGRLLHVDAAFSYFNDDPGNIRNRAETGGGSVPDIGVYTLGGARFATGAEPERLAARVRRAGGVDVFAHVWAEFDGFTFAGFTSTRMCPRQEVVFHGETGVLRLAAPFNAGVFGEATVELQDTANGRRLERFPGVNQYVLQVENACAAIRGEAAFACPLEFSRGTQAAIDRVLSEGVPLD